MFLARIETIGAYIVTIFVVSPGSVSRAGEAVLGAFGGVLACAVAGAHWPPTNIFTHINTATRNSMHMIGSFFLSASNRRLILLMCFFTFTHSRPTH